jgi:hypothetical protein
LIHVANIGSKKTFEACAYHAYDEQCSLLVSSSGVVVAQQEQDTDLYLVWVNTISYRGLWIEGSLSAAGFKAANAIRARHNLDLVGAVIPTQASSTVQVSRSAGYQHFGQYQFWITELNWF